MSLVQYYKPSILNWTASRLLVVCVQFLLVFTIVDHSAITLGDYVYPAWADGLGWLMFAVVVIWIPLIAVIELVRARRAHPFLSLSVRLSFVCFSKYYYYGWIGSRVVSVLDSGAEGPGFKSQPQRCRVTVLGKLFTPIVGTRTDEHSVHQAVKLVAALVVARVTAGLAENNGSLPPGV